MKQTARKSTCSISTQEFAQRRKIPGNQKPTARVPRPLQQRTSSPPPRPVTRSHSKHVCSVCVNTNVEGSL